MGLPRRLLSRCVLGMLVALVLAGCTHATGAASSSAAGRTSSTSAPRPSAVGAATSTDDNMAETRRFAAWLLHAVPMPPGAREWRRSPTVHYRHASVGIGPSDVRLTRTTWWTVPLSSEAFDSWLRSDAPRRLRGHSDASGPSESEGVWEHDRDFHRPSTVAHTRGWVNFAFTPYGDGLVVRVDTFTGARFARTVLVPADATSVRIRRTERPTRAGAHEHTTVRVVTGSRAVAELVAMVNALPGAMRGQFTVSCPPVLTQQSYAMRFATPTGSYVAALPDTSCVPTLRLRHDGVPAGPRLDPGRRFTETADSYLR